jgi:hypothetical protein
MNFKDFYFILLYLVTPVLLYVLPAYYNVPIKVFFLGSNIIIFLNLLFSNKFIIESRPLIFSISLFLLALLVVFNKDLHWTIPFYYLTGYISYIQFKYIGNIQTKLQYLIVGSYIFFYIVYFSKLPGFINRPGFDESVFYVSSSNTIAIALNIYMLTYVAYGIYHNKLQHKKVILFGIINIILIFIQQSRIGLLVAIIILFIPWLSSLKKKSISKYFFLTFILGIIYYSIQFYLIDSSIGDFSLDGYLLDSRGLIQFLFFLNLSGDLIFWGYPLDYIYYAEFERVYNMFLLNYNYTTIIGFIIIIYFFFFRILNSKRYFFPTIIILPIVLYGMVEEIFLPMGWDFVLYLALFLKIKSPKSSLNKKPIDE